MSDKHTVLGRLKVRLHGGFKSLWERRYPGALILAGMVGSAGLLLWARSALDGAPTATVIGIALTVFSLVASMAVALHQGYKLSEQGGRLGKILHLNQKLMFSEVTLQIFSRIQDNEKLNARMHDGQVAIKKGLGLAMHKLRLSGSGSSLLDSAFVNRNVFIESGSTNAYIALQMSLRLKERDSGPCHHYTTNNHLAYMTLITQPRCRIRLYPGCPSGKYGATFGRDFDHFEKAGHDEFFKTTAPKELSGFLGNDTEVIMLAMSRLHLACGPHVGSPENAVFKSLLLDYARERRIPVVVVLDYSKIEVDLEQPSTEEGCHPVYRGTGHQADSWDPEGFNKFCDDIASGLIFLMIGFENPSAPPLEVKTLRDQVQRYNASLGEEPTRAVALGSHPSEGMGIMSMYAMEIEQIVSGGVGKDLARMLSQV